MITIMFTMLVWLGSHLPAGANLLLYRCTTWRSGPINVWFGSHLLAGASLLLWVYNMAVRATKCLVWFSPPSWHQSAPVLVQCTRVHCTTWRSGPINVWLGSHLPAGASLLLYTCTWRSGPRVWPAHPAGPPPSSG